MDIEIQLPQEMEVEELKYDDKTRTLKIKPLFRTPSSMAPLGHLKVQSGGGAVIRSAIRVNGRRGTISITELTSDSSEFDQLTQAQLEALRTEDTKKKRPSGDEDDEEA